MGSVSSSVSGGGNTDYRHLHLKHEHVKGNKSEATLSLGLLISVPKDSPCIYRMNSIFFLRSIGRVSNGYGDYLENQKKRPHEYHIL